MAEQRPHIILLTLDATRRDRLPIYGYEGQTMPRFWQWAEEAQIFDAAYSNAPWTLPSHASLFTGLPPHLHKATQRTLHLEASFPHLARALGEMAGYRTHLFATNAWFAAATGLSRGFEVVHGDPIHRQKTLQRRLRNLKVKIQRLLPGREMLTQTESVIRTMISLLDEAGANAKPLFLFANLMEAHLPLRPSVQALATMGIDRDAQVRLAQIALPATEQKYIAGVVDLTAEDLDLLARGYDAALRDLDGALAPLWARLSRPDLRGRVLVIITADHGEHLGEKGLLGHQFSLYEPLIHVPLSISWPGVLPAGRRGELVQLSDLYHTILAISPLTRDLDHVDPDLSLIESPSQRLRERDTVFVAYDRPTMALKTIERYTSDPQIIRRLDQSLTAVQGIQYKLIVSTGAESRTSRLFDLQVDPEERHDLSPILPDIKRDMEEKLEIWLAKGDPERMGEADALLDALGPEVRQRLQDLGYL